MVELAQLEEQRCEGGGVSHGMPEGADAVGEAVLHPSAGGRQCGERAICLAKGL